MRPPSLEPARAHDSDNPAPAPRRNRTRRFAALVRLGLAALAVVLVLAGCASPGSGELSLGPSFQPQNVYRAAPTLPHSLQRVAVLPLATHQNAEAVAGRDRIENVLRLALSRRGAFELVFIEPEKVQAWSGQSRWTAEEPLPADFFEQLRQRFGCDAVLFPRLTVYRPYTPIALGWNFKLVDVQTASAWWAADEVFDAGVPSVARAARRYHRKNLADGKSATDSTIILNSPRLFAEYSLDALLATLPGR